MRVIDNWYRIDNVSSLEKIKLQSDLIFTSKKFDKFVGGNDTYTINLYKEENGIVTIPVPYGIKIFGIDNAEDRRTNPNVAISFNDDLWKQNGMYYERQKKCIDVVYPILKRINSGVICMATGAGKTVIGLKLASLFGGPLIILLHRLILIEQWYFAIQKWCNILAQDIGFIRQDVCIADKPIVLASLQTLLERKFAQELYDRFAFVIIDEVHHVAAEVFHTVVPLFKAKIRLGLTGQLRRSDNMEGVVIAQVGSIIYKDLKNIYPADFYLAKCNIYCKPSWFTYNTREGKKINLPKLLTIITKDYMYRALLVKFIRKLLELNRKVLVLTHRVAFCKFLYLEFQRYKDKKVSIVVSDIKQDVKGSDLIVSTYQMLSEGIDLTDHDTVVLATPTASINQAIGRILRGSKNNISIYDIEFTIPEIQHWFVNHKRLASQRQWNIIERNLQDLT